MRLATSALVGAIGLVIGVGAASASPIAPKIGTAPEANIVQVAGGCGWGFHHNRWGHCVRNHYSYYRPYRHWGGYYGGGWASPSDNVANELNRRQLWHGGYGWGY